MIELQGITKSFDKIKAVNDVSVTIHGQNIFGLLGINGAGKSTLLRMMAGILKPDAGRILMDSRQLGGGDVLKSREETVSFCLTLKNVYRDEPFHDPNWTVIRHRKNKKIFAWIFEKDSQIWVNVKCDPEWRDLWRNTYNSVKPGWHLNKEHWNSIILDGTVPEAEVKRMVRESYDLTKPQQKYFC